MERGVAQTNEAITQANNRVFEVLEQIANVQLPRVPQEWWHWWQNYNELYGDQKPIVKQRFARITPYYVPIATLVPALDTMSCFPAGTLVHGETGPIAIEHIQVGDRVLSQDLETGELAYKLVLRTTERPPSQLLKITLGDATITTTKGHPFWVNGLGWRMAKRLQIGQQLHCFGGARTIDHITSATKAKAYNLVVADYATYFVGAPGVLVHDNTYRKPTRVLTPGLPAGDNVALR